MLGAHTKNLIHELEARAEVQRQATAQSIRTTEILRGPVRSECAIVGTRDARHVDEAGGVQVRGGRKGPRATLGPSGDGELVSAQGLSKAQEVIGPALEGAARLKVGPAYARSIGAHKSQAIGLRRRIKQLSLQAA